MRYLLFLLITCSLFVACEILRPAVENNPDQPDPPQTEIPNTDPKIEVPPTSDPEVDPQTYPPGNAQVWQWIHRPLHPDNGQSVQFKLNAQEPVGATKVVLQVYEYEWYRNANNLPSKRRRANGQWGTAKTWNFDQPQIDLNLAYTFQKGFPAATNVEYVFEIYSTDGKRTDKLALFDAGDSLWPNDKIMLYATSRHELNQSINLCFLPDTDYGTRTDPKKWSLFLGDVEDLIYSGYHRNNMIADQKESWAFFYTKEAVDGFQLALDYGNPARYPSFMKNNIIDGIDAFGLLHRNEYSDGAYLYGNLQFLAHNLFTSESYNHGTAIHETAHAIFNLSDEYNGCACFESNDGTGTNVFTRRSTCEEFNRMRGFGDVECTELSGYDGRKWYMSEKNMHFPTLTACHDYNRSKGFPIESCITFIDSDQTTTYRSNDGLCIMQDDGDHIIRPFQQTCGSLIEDYYQRLELMPIASAPIANQDNAYGYEKIVLLEVEDKQGNWDIQAKEQRYGIPSKNSVTTDAYTLAVKSQDGQPLFTTGVDQPTKVKFEGRSEPGHQTIKTKSAKYTVSIPYRENIRNVELYNNQPPRAMPGQMIVKGSGLVGSWKLKLK